ncbi:hypothetical protein GBA52_022432 [Prunus armeniaca]|nr:hypothetical protein GBA52_022432 [Prunus armeniaca]
MQSDWISSIVVGGSLLLEEVERVDGDIAALSDEIEDERMTELGKLPPVWRMGQVLLVKPEMITQSNCPVHEVAAAAAENTSF